MIDVLITGGCSVSVVSPDWPRRTWAWHLGQELASRQQVHTARPAQGNGLISRQIIYTVLQHLNNTPAEGIRVAVIWSGPSRHEFYTENTEIDDQYHVGVTGASSFVNGGYGRWVLLNHHWTNDSSKMFYRYMHDGAGSMISTCEHILRTQWFLQQHGIKYWMSTLSSEVFDARWNEHPDIAYLRDAIDFDKFLPIEHGIYEWARDHSGLEYDASDLCHPTTEQNHRFTQQVILPFMRAKDMVS
jgi:hypothetical protein